MRQAIADPPVDVQLVPVVMLWGRAPDKQDSILKALFAETWRAPGRLRQFFAVLLHGRQALLRFGAPLSLRSCCRDEPDEARALRKLARVLRVHFRRQREIAIGPDLSHRNTQVDACSRRRRVRAAIAAEAAAKIVRPARPSAAPRLRPGDRLRLHLRRGARLRAVPDLAVDSPLRRRRGAQLRGRHAHRPGQEIVYLPCHRSHIDYLLLSYVVYQRGLTPPHIAAGANLNIPVVGRCCAAAAPSSCAAASRASRSTPRCSMNTCT
jgi:glycerol-3-phosphate O-acyltransferase